MKKRSILFVSFLCLAAFESCDKKSIIEEENQAFYVQIEESKLSAELLTRENIKWILSNDDKEDLEINKNVYYLGIALTNAIKDENCLNEIERISRNSQLNAISFEELVTNYPESENLINSKLKSTDFSVFAYKKDLTLQSISKNIHYQGIDYTPVIFIPNLKIADFTLPPYISPGIEVLDDKEMGIENAIIAWKLIEKDRWEEVLLMEDEAMNMKNPLLVISFTTAQCLEYEKVKNYACYDYYADQKKQAKTNGTSYSTGNFQIDYRYENSGDSEFNIASMSRDENGFVEYEYYKHICDVDKDDIKKPLTSNTYFGFKPYNYQAFIFNTFENDWYAANKYIGELNSWALFAQMKYANEWYAFEPSINNENNPWKLPNSGSKYQYSKGYIQTVGSYIP